MTTETVEEKITDPVIQTNKYYARSEAYRQYTTKNITDRITMKTGWEPYRINMVNTHTPERRGFQRHMVHMRNPSWTMLKVNNQLTVDTLIPELIITNSHDGTTPLTVAFGIHRVVCSNGLVIPTKYSMELRYRHHRSGLDLDKVCDEIVTTYKEFDESGNVKTTIEIIRKMMDTNIDKEQLKDLTMRSLNIRWGKRKETHDHIDTLSLAHLSNEHTRNESAWHSFNNVQRLIMTGKLTDRLKGCINYFDTTSQGVYSEPIRPIKNIAKQIDINRRLMELWAEITPKD